MRGKARRLVLAGGAAMLSMALVPVITVLLVLGGQQESSASCQPVSELSLGTPATPSAPSASSQDPHWPDFLAALRQQETGSRQGDYTHRGLGCEGAYCFLDSSVWRSMASEAGVDVSRYPDAAEAPSSIQDEVATGVLWPVYERAGGGQGGYLQAAAAWNGGTIAVVTNSSLGTGATNYTYANQVLAKMARLLGQGLGASGPSGGAASSSSPQDCSSTVAGGSYANPLRGVVGLAPERIDQGVDYGGSGPVYAIGDGQVENVYNPGWPGGVFIAYRLTSGPDAGKGVYVAENLIPQVTVGQHVSANTVLATLEPAFPNMETGWADLSALGTTRAMAEGQAASAGDAGTVSTGCGRDFSAFLAALGAPGGILQAGAVLSTTC